MNGRTPAFASMAGPAEHAKWSGVSIVLSKRQNTGHDGFQIGEQMDNPRDRCQAQSHMLRAAGGVFLSLAAYKASCLYIKTQDKIALGKGHTSCIFFVLPRLSRGKRQSMATRRPPYRIKPIAAASDTRTRNHDAVSYIAEITVSTRSERT